jgi:hypothetical protein
MSRITLRASSSRLPRRKRPVCPGKSINLDDYCVMLLDGFGTIKFSPLLVLPKAPTSPRRGFLFGGRRRPGSRIATSAGLPEIGPALIRVRRRNTHASRTVSSHMSEHIVPAPEWRSAQRTARRQGKGRRDVSRLRDAFYPLGLLLKDPRAAECRCHAYRATIGAAFTVGSPVLRSLVVDRPNAVHFSSAPFILENRSDRE